MRLLLTLAVLTAAAPAVAQQNGNVYNGTSHEPAKGDVIERERTAGVLPPEQAQKRKDGDVEQLGNQVLRQSQDTMPKSPPAPPIKPNQ